MNIIQKIEKINERNQKLADEVFFRNINLFSQHTPHGMICETRRNSLASMTFYKCPECMEYAIIIQKTPTIRETLKLFKEESSC